MFTLNIFYDFVVHHTTPFEKCIYFWWIKVGTVLHITVGPLKVYKKSEGQIIKRLYWFNFMEMSNVLLLSLWPIHRYLMKYCVLTIFICSTIVQTRYVSMYLNKIDFAMLQCKRSMYVCSWGGRSWKFNSRQTLYSQRITFENTVIKPVEMALLMCMCCIWVFTLSILGRQQHCCGAGTCRF